MHAVVMLLVVFLALTALQCVPCQLDEPFVFENETVAAKPNVDAFLGCNTAIQPTQWTCWQNAAKSFQTDETKFLFEWPKQRAECCAVKMADECVYNSRQQFIEDCKHKLVVEYFLTIKMKYEENGCKPFWNENHTEICSTSFAWRTSAVATLLVMALVIGHLAMHSPWSE